MRLAVVAMIAASPAYAEVTVGACQPGVDFGDLVTFARFDCDVTNVGSVAVAALTYSASFTEEGREVPWGVNSGGLLGRTPQVIIPGGIEPGETVSVTFTGALLPDRADPASVIIDLTVLEAFDVGGNPIP